jgi:hypothetical protein
MSSNSATEGFANCVRINIPSKVIGKQLGNTAVKSLPKQFLKTEAHKVIGL